MVTVCSSFSGVALADQYDDQIANLRNAAASAQSIASQYAQQVNTYQAKVSELQAQINAFRAQINLNQAQYNQVTAQINANQVKLDQQKASLGANLKSMYLNSSVTPIEMIASSDNLSDYFNQQQYEDSIKNKIQSAMSEILNIQNQLQAQQKQVSNIIANLQGEKAAVDAQQAQMNQLLAVAAQNEATANAQVQAANSQINSLRSAQAASFAKFSGSTSSNGPLSFKNLSFGGACGGGYPVSAGGSHGAWGCGMATDAGIDNWDLYNRECVSYAAWAMTNRGGSVPDFHGNGNAYEWPSYLAGKGYRVDSNPAGSRVVAIVPTSMIGGVGHAMVVENGGSLSGGYIHVSQYNWWPTENGPYGIYSTMDVKPAGLIFIHF